MTKLKLDLQKLSVESFETSVLKTEKGTVKANNEDTTFPHTEISCPNTCVSCEVSCGYTCLATCANTICNNHTCEGSCEAPCHG